MIPEQVEALRKALEDGKKVIFTFSGKAFLEAKSVWHKGITMTNGGELHFDDAKRGIFYVAERLFPDE